jgi:hypothetical protein
MADNEREAWRRGVHLRGEETQVSEIWRYEIGAVRNELLMPQGAVVRSVGWTRGKPQLWAEVEPGGVKELRSFQLVTSGETVPAGSAFVGMIDAGDGFHVFHVFEIGGAS